MSQSRKEIREHGEGQRGSYYVGQCYDRYGHVSGGRRRQVLNELVALCVIVVGGD